MMETKSGSSSFDLEHKVRLASEIIRSFERAARTRRIYEPDHQLYIQVTDQLVDRFREFFDAYSYLRLSVSSEALLMDDRPLLKAKAHEAEIPFRMYKDGIREIRFHRGLPKEEILDFLSLFEVEVRELRQIGEDFVSMLWTKEFQSVDYLAVDEFDLDEEPVADPAWEREREEAGKQIDRITTAIRVGAGVPGDELEGGKVGRPESTEGGAPHADPVELPVPALVRVFEAEISGVAEKIRLEVENETLGGAIQRSMAILFKLYENETDPSQDHAEPLFRGVTGYYTRKGDFGTLGHLLQRIRGTDLIGKGEKGDRTFGEILASVRESATPGKLIKYFTREFVGDYEGTRLFFSFLGREGWDLAASIFGRIPDRKAREAVGAFLEKGMVELTPDVCRTLLRNGGRHLVDALHLLGKARPPRLHELLEEYVSNKDDAVRLAVYETAAGSQGPRRAPLLLRAVDDRERRVRIAAYRAMTESRDPNVGVRLEELVRSRGFARVPPEEKNAILRALGATSGMRSVPVLRGLVESRAPLLQRGPHQEMRHAAVYALAHLNTPPALALLEKHAQGRDRDLAASCKAALRDLQEGRLS